MRRFQSIRTALGTPGPREIVLAAALLLPLQAKATIIITTAEVGTDVVFSFSGDLDITGLTSANVSNTGEVVSPLEGDILFGAHTGLEGFSGGPLTLPAFGTGRNFFGTGTGDTFQIYSDDRLGLPTGYGGEVISLAA